MGCLCSTAPSAKPADVHAETQTPADVSVIIPADAKCEDLVPLSDEIRGTDFTFLGETFMAKIVHVYDGDTGRMKFDYKGVRMQWKFRLAGIDTPELHPRKDAPNREVEMRAAQVSKKVVETIIGNKVVRVVCGEFDKYGRVLATIFTPGDETSLNQWLVDKGCAVPYDGGTKKVFVPHAADD